MKSIYHIMVIGVMAIVFTGCETIKSTLSGPFIGLEKDINNFQAATQQTTPAAEPAAPAQRVTQAVPVATEEAPQKSVKKSINDLDEWIKKNWW